MVTFFFGNSVEGNSEVSSAYYNSQTVPLLAAALHLDPNPSKGGGDILTVEDKALLPEAGPSGTLADIEERPASSDQISVYVVREGDSLSQIAQMFDVSVNTIRWANDIKSDKGIHPGQTLVILPISGVRHTVVKGDTLASIVKKYQGDMDEVLVYNGLSEGVTLAVGSVVVIPNGEVATPVVPSRSSSIAGSGGSLPSAAGYFIRPLNGIKTQGLHGYNGIDIGASAGSPVVASAGGEVIVARSAGWNGGYGVYVVIKHGNGTQTLYAHLSSLAIYGGSVVQGQVIGYVGSTGRSTGNHLHFEVRGARNPF